MSEYCVIVADAARARFFTLEPRTEPETESGPKLLERKTLVNPEGELREGEVFDSARGGRNRGAGGAMHGFDDHRAHHTQEFARRFAKLVAAETLRLAKDEHARHVVLVADSRMIGLLRKEMAAHEKNGLDVRDLARDMTKRTPAEIQEHLAREEFVPPCRKPGQA